MKQYTWYFVFSLLCAVATAGAVANIHVEKGGAAPDLSVPSSNKSSAHDFPGPATAFRNLTNPARAAFTLQVGDLASPFRILSVPVMPGEQVRISANEPDPASSSFRATNSSGILIRTGGITWNWTASDQPGVSTVRVTREDGDEVIVNFLVMAPYSGIRRGSLNGYAIGTYPVRGLGSNPAYNRPQGFVEVTPESGDVMISPHFQLKQFLCKQVAGYPKYLVLNERLVVKLELLLEKLNQRGYNLETLHVMSGYRTPSYNAGLGNVKYSMHQFGYAADVFADQNPKDGNMDDLNGDRKIDQRDAAVLMSVIEDMDRSEEYRRFSGGLGMYEKTTAHGPFVHVDVRGPKARW